MKTTDSPKQQRRAEITIIIGNPPYNTGQINENDNNKNRDYPLINQRVRATYSSDSAASNRNALNDMYVKFFRWATDRLGNRDGIICFVSNNGFLDGIAFDGFRKHLAQDFTHIYHLDLGGNARKESGGSVFNIMVGVGITILVRKRSSNQPPTAATIWYHPLDNTLSGNAKRAVMETLSDSTHVPWQTLQPDRRQTWLTHGLHPEFYVFLPMGTRAAKLAKTADVAVIFKVYSLGISTSRDAWLYNYQQKVLQANVRRLISNYNSEVDRWKQAGSEDSIVDDFVEYDDTKIKWSEGLKYRFMRQAYTTFQAKNVRRSLYRPFCKQYLYFDRASVERVYQFPRIFPTPATEEENVAICVSSIGHRTPFTALVTPIIPDLNFTTTDTGQCFPFYTYDEDGTNRQENITDWALAQFQARCGNDVTKWDIFHYIYAMLHHPTYRERYAKNLKRDLPHIPLPSGAEAFTTLAMHGKSLADLHLHYEHAPKYALQEQAVNDGDRAWCRIEKMQLSKDRTQLIVNPWITLSDIPPLCFDYRLGNRSALEWVIDQYQVKTDSRSGIVNDPNREDDQTYIIDLVKRVIHVSIETVRIVREIEAWD